MNHSAEEARQELDAILAETRELEDLAEERDLYPRERDRLKKLFGARDRIKFFLLGHHL
jgi:hypothetical protein